MSKVKSQAVKLNKVVLNNLPNVGVLVVKTDNRVNNTGRPVNKKSARQARLAKQAFYASVNEKFISGNTFKVSNSEYKYSVGKNGDTSRGCIYNTVTGYVCNVEYVGRTKVKGYTFVLGKKVNVELNLKTLEFVS